MGRRGGDDSLSPCLTCLRHEAVVHGWAVVTAVVSASQIHHSGNLPPWRTPAGKYTGINDTSEPGQTSAVVASAPIRRMCSQCSRRSEAGVKSRGKAVDQDIAPRRPRVIEECTCAVRDRKLRHEPHRIPDLPSPPAHSRTSSDSICISLTPTRRSLVSGCRLTGT